MLTREDFLIQPPGFGNLITSQELVSEPHSSQAGIYLEFFIHTHTKYHSPTVTKHFHFQYLQQIFFSNLVFCNICNIYDQLNTSIVIDQDHMTSLEHLEMLVIVMV